jgi:hypothetical protein
MGLTIHYALTFQPEHKDKAEAQIKDVVTQMRDLALKFKDEGRFDAVTAAGFDGRKKAMAVAWVIVPLPSDDDIPTSTGIEVTPSAGKLFFVSVGQGCEPLLLGLCQYPAKVKGGRREFDTGRGEGWSLQCFCKTQYASRQGWEHFARCHCAVVDYLAALEPLGVRAQIMDEGGYWPGRCLKTLRQKIDEMNGIVAATAGILKDLADESGGQPVESPIFEHPQFERLEAEGAPRTKGLRRLFKKRGLGG